MLKGGEDIVGATRFSQDLARKVSKTCRYVIWGLGGVGSGSGKMTQLCLEDDVMRNVMDEEMTTGLWSRL